MDSFDVTFLKAVPPLLLKYIFEIVIYLLALLHLLAEVSDVLYGPLRNHLASIRGLHRTLPLTSYLVLFITNCCLDCVKWKWVWLCLNKSGKANDVSRSHQSL